MSIEKRVLIVDDNRLARMNLAHLVAQDHPNWTLTEASAAPEAISTADSTQFDFILLDVNMPGMNGIELAAILLRTQSTASIALCTANVQDSMRRKAEELGLHFIAKPVKKEALSGFISTRG